MMNRHFAGILMLVLFGFMAFQAADARIEDSDAPSDSANMPITFVPNAGQSESVVQFLAHTLGGTVFFTQNNVTFELPALQSDTGNKAVSNVLQLHFEDANPSVSIVGDILLDGRVNYLLGNRPSQWLTNIPTYAGVTYTDLYPGIDLHYSGENAAFKGTYTIEPGRAVSDIRWGYEGVRSLNLDTSTGDLQIELPDGTIMTERAPTAWQTIAGHDVPVSIQYDTDWERKIGFVVGDYDPSYELIIDPVLQYGSYIGGSRADSAWGIAADDSGNAYITGSTESTDFPATVGTVSQTRSGQRDAFVVKVNTNAVGAASLVWATYLGGSGATDGWDIDVDPDGNVYVAGTTGSTDFPVTGSALQPALGQGMCCSPDAYLAKLNPDGSALLYATFLGGIYAEDGYAVSVDTSGNAYVYGATDSNNFPVTASAYQTTNPLGHRKVFVTKVDPTQSGMASLLYSTYYGGTASDSAAGGIAVDDTGHAYISGIAQSTDLPMTANAYQPTRHGEVDSFVAGFDTTQSGAASFIYASYLGGSSAENFNGAGDIDTDGLGNIYVTGETNSTDFPMKNAYQSTYGGGAMDVYVAKIDTTVSGAAGLAYSTYLGGNNFDQGWGIAATRFGNLYVTGQSRSANFPLLKPIHVANAGFDGSFVAKIDTTLVGASSLMYSTFLGGGNGYGGAAVDGDGTAYVAGQVAAIGFPIVNGFQSTYAGNTDGYLAKLAFRSDLDITKTVSPDPAPVNEEVTITITVRNTGPETATGVLVTEVLPPTVNFVSAVTADGTCTYATNVVSCAPGNILLNATKTITIVVEPQASALMIPMIQYASLTSDVSALAFGGVDPLAPSAQGGAVSVTANADAVEKDLNAPNNSVTKNFGVYDFTALVPTTVSPPDGASSATNPPTLRWNTIPGAVSYNVAFGLTNPSSTIVANVSETSFTFPGPLATGTYSWRIQGVSASGQVSDWSLPRTLTIQSTASAAPMFSFFTTHTPTITWTPNTKAIGYEVQINNAPLFNGTYNYVTSVGADALSLQTPALINGTYYWRVRAKLTATTNGAWSATQVMVVNGAS